MAELPSRTWIWHRLLGGSEWADKMEGCQRRTLMYDADTYALDCDTVLIRDETRRLEAEAGRLEAEARRLLAEVRTKVTPDA